MRGWKGMVFVIWLVLAVRPVAGQPQLGKYLCITDYSAGIILQPDGSLAAGQITAAPEKQKFFVTIRAELARGEERPQCFTKQQGEALKYEPPPPPDKLKDWLIARYLDWAKKNSEREKADPNYTSPLIYDTNQFIQYCLSNFTADVADHRYLHSFDGTTFSDYQSLEVVFQLFGPKFHLYERNWAALKPAELEFNDVVYRGRCEVIQAAKIKGVTQNED
jgi:hypothetical protein